MSTPDHPAKTSSESEMAYFSAAKLLSPRRKSSSCETISDLAIEQLQHFGIEPQSEYGEAMLDAVEKLYATQADIVRLWDVTTKTIEGLNKEDRIAYFNAKKFLSFQVAKILDTLQKSRFEKPIKDWNCLMILCKQKDPIRSLIM